MAESTVEPTRQRTASLDERVLDAGTTQRFVLLLVLFVAESTATAYDFVSRLAKAAGGGAVPTWVSYVALAVLVATAVCVYVTLPKWKGRRSRVIPLAAIEDGGHLREELDRLVELAELKVKPRFVVAPGAASVGAVVFGTGGEPTVCLNAGLVVTRTTDAERFRTVVLHELAHIRNDDVGITYATEAMWRVLLAAALLPDTVLILVTRVVGVTAIGADALIQAVVIVALVYLTRADILRRRELYADRTAARLWHVGHDAMPSEGPERTGAESRRVRAVAAFVEAWRTHPSWRLRGRSLTDPEELFAMRALPMVITGIAAEIAAVQLTSPFGGIAAGIAAVQLTSPFGATNSWLGMAQYLLISGLVVGVGGVALWRASVHAVLTGRRTLSGWVAGMWLGVGLAIGELTNGQSGGRLLPAHPEMFAILIAVVALLMAWSAQFAELRIRTYRGESLNVAMVIGLIAPGLVLAFVLLWWNTGHWLTGWHYSVSGELAHAKLPSTNAPTLLRLTATLTNLPGSDLGFTGLWWAVPLLWLVPLQLWLARLPRSAPSWLTRSITAVRNARVRLPGGESWWAVLWLMIVLVLVALVGFAIFIGSLVGLGLLMDAGPVGYITLATLAWLVCLLRWRRRRRNVTGYWLDQAQPGSAPLVMDAPELRWVIRVGMLGGLVCWVGLLAEPVATRAASVFHSWQVNSEVDLAWIVVVISTVMAVVAGVAAVLARGRYPLITGLIAAGVTAAVGIVGQYLKGTVDGCLGPLNNLTTTCGWQPLRFLPLVEYALGYVLGPALLVAGLVAGGSSLLVRRARTAPIVDAAEPRQLARPMVAVGFLNAIAVCLVVAVTAYQTPVWEAPIPTDNLLFEYATSPTRSPPTGDPQANWIGYVGDTVGRYGSAFGDIENLRNKLTDDIPGDVRSIAQTVPPACATFVDIAQHADDNARQIDPAMQDAGEQLWIVLLAHVRTTATDCVTLEHATTSAEILAALKALDTDGKTTMSAAQALLTWVEQLNRRLCQFSQLLSHSSRSC
jgi:Zn-dependent protease with chaperone function